MLSPNGPRTRNAHQQGEILLEEWMWVGKWFLLLLALIGLPYLVAFLFPPEGMTFLGSFGNPDDTSAYLSAMREGARGGWLRNYPSTNEPHEPALYFPFYILLGKLFGLSLAVFHGARLACALLRKLISEEGITYLYYITARRRRVWAVLTLRTHPI